MNYFYGEAFLDKFFTDLYMSDEVQHTKDNKDNRLQAINKYLDRLTRIHSKADTESKKRLLEKLYYDKYVVKEEDLPNNIDKKAVIEVQKKSLSQWLEYLSSKETDIYPSWVKYWAFQGMRKLGSFDGIKESYQKRDKNTLAPFVDCNPEIVTKCMDTIMNLVKGLEINDDIEEKLNKTDSFKRIYTTFKNRYKKKITSNKDNLDGIWIEYTNTPESIDKMIKSIEDKNTGWCIASHNRADAYAEHGNFYIYYTKDNDNNYTIPRIVILKSGVDGIDEIRGIEPSENLEQCMIEPLEKKLNEPGFISEYAAEGSMQRVMDLRELYTIGKKTEKGKPLTEKEIEDFYTKKFGFGYGQDPMYEKIFKKRNYVEDYNNLSKEYYKRVLITKDVLPDNYISDRSLMEKALGSNPDCLRVASKDIRSDRELIKNLISNKTLYCECFRYADDSLKNDKKYVLDLIDIAGFDSYHLYNALPESMKTDSDIIFKAIANDFYTYKCVPEDLQKDPEFTKKAIKTNILAMTELNEELKNNKEFIIEMMNEGYNGIFDHADKKIRGDFDIAYKYISNGGSLYYVSNELKKDYDIAAAALINNGNDYEYLSDDLKNKKDLTIIALSNEHNDRVSMFIPDELLIDKEIALLAVKYNGYRVLSRLPRELKEDREFMNSVNEVIEYSKKNNKSSRI